MQFPIIPYTPDQIQSFAPEQAMQAILPFSLEDKIAIAMVMLYRLKATAARRIAIVEYVIAKLEAQTPHQANLFE